MSFFVFGDERRADAPVVDGIELFLELWSGAAQLCLGAAEGVFIRGRGVALADLSEALNDFAMLALSAPVVTEAALAFFRSKMLAPLGDRARPGFGIFGQGAGRANEKCWATSDSVRHAQ